MFSEIRNKTQEKKEQNSRKDVQISRKKVQHFRKKHTKLKEKGTKIKKKGTKLTTLTMFFIGKKIQKKIDKIVIVLAPHCIEQDK